MPGWRSSVCELDEPPGLLDVTLPDWGVTCDGDVVEGDVDGDVDGDVIEGDVVEGIVEDEDGAVVRCIGNVAPGVIWPGPIRLPYWLLPYWPLFICGGELLKKRAAASPSANALARNATGF